MLRHRRKPLVQQVLETEVVRAYEEVAPPQVRPPMPHSLHQPNKLALISSKLEVASGERMAEEGEGPGALM